MSDERYAHFTARQEQKRAERARLETTVLPPSDQLNALLEQYGTTPVQTGVRLIDLLKRPQLTYEALTPVDPDRPTLDPLVMEQVEVELKYEGYIRRQQSLIDEMRRLENRVIPADMDFYAVRGLRKEAQEKLTRIRPHSIGQASRISGVSPADVSVLIMATGGDAHD